MSDKKRFNKPGSLQPNIEDILQWNDLPADAFDPATSEEKENFIQDRRSVSYWKDAWRRLRKNTVAMVALVIIILLSVSWDRLSFLILTNSRSVVLNLYIHGTTAWRIRIRSMLTWKNITVQKT